MLERGLDEFSDGADGSGNINSKGSNKRVEEIKGKILCFSRRIQPQGRQCKDEFRVQRKALHTSIT